MLRRDVVVMVVDMMMMVLVVMRPMVVRGWHLAAVMCVLMSVLVPGMSGRRVRHVVRALRLPLTFAFAIAREPVTFRTLPFPLGDHVRHAFAVATLTLPVDALCISPSEPAVRLRVSKRRRYRSTSHSRRDPCARPSAI